MPVGSVAVTGARGPVRARLIAVLAADSAVGGEDALPRSDTLVHFASSDELGGPIPAAKRRPATSPADRGTAHDRVDVTRRVFAAAGRSGVRSIVHVSSAIVYGAWADNAVPLTEDAALRPNPGVYDAVADAESERIALDWAKEHPTATVAVLRPTTVVGPGIDSWLARALAGHTSLRPDQADPPRQFLHVDDLVSAIAHAARERLDGTFNVAPDGSVSGEVVRGLTAGRPSVPVPARIAGAARRWGWAAGLSDLPPAATALVEQPWVVANDRLRGTGWVPAYTSEEAVVAGRPGSWWREMSPARRQQVALAGAGVALTGAAAGVAAVLSRMRRR